MTTSASRTFEGDLVIARGPDRIRIRAAGSRVRVDLSRLGLAWRLRKFRPLARHAGVRVSVRWRGVPLPTF